MRQYHELMQRVLDNGVDRSDRTGTGTRSIFGHQMRFDLSEGFPLLTTKKLHVRSIIYELLWFLRGETNTEYLKNNGVNIWEPWADENGELGPVYGAQWRSCSGSRNSEGIDQLANVVKEIRENPESRRMIVSSWNVQQISEMKLPPCHCLFQFYVSNGRLSCQLYQRSADIFIGVPFNIASYAILVHLIAMITGLKVGEFIHTFGDAHLYSNHIDLARKQLLRKPLQLPRLVIKKEASELKEFFDFDANDFQIIGYDNAHGHIEAPIAV